MRNGPTVGPFGAEDDAEPAAPFGEPSPEEFCAQLVDEDVATDDKEVLLLLLLW